MKNKTDIWPPKAIHIMWSAPKLKKNLPIFEDFELLTLVLSALLYRKYNNEITFYTDLPTYNLLLENDLCWAWNEINYNVLEDSVSKNSGYSGIENFAKIWLQGELKPPFLYIDNDAIIAEKLPKSFKDQDFCFAHYEKSESSYTRWYPKVSTYPLRKEYIDTFKFDEENSEIFNTALFYFGSVDLQQIYKNEYESFLKSLTTKDLKSAEFLYLFLDQRLMGLISNKFPEFKVKPFIPYQWNMDKGVMEKLNLNGEFLQKFHHTWGGKKVLSKSLALKNDYCKKLINEYQRFLKPEDLERILKNPLFKNLKL